MGEPIRVLHVVTHMNRGGLETMLMNYYRHIDREQVQFDFLVHRQERAAYDDEIEQLGGVIYRLPQLNPVSPDYLKKLDGFFATHPEYRIIHSHLDCMAGIPLKYAKKYGVPVRIAHAHSSNQTKDSKYLLKLCYKRNIVRYATKLFACSIKAGKWMFGTDNFAVLNNAIDTAAYAYDEKTAEEVRAELGIGPEAFVVGHVGRFSVPKNHNFLIQIFAQVLKRRPEARLLLVGDGELRQSIEEKVCELGIEENVIFTGVRTDVPRLLQIMDVFLFPSLYEGFGIVAIEAQAVGIPCVISDTIPTDCDLTKQILRLSLEDTPENWAHKVCGCANADRKDGFAKVAAAGFDIQEKAKWLESYYCDVVSNKKG